MATSLGSMDLAHLDDSPDVVCGLDERLTLGYFNQGWEDFARDHAAPDFGTRWGLGASLLDAISEPSLREFYARALGRVAPGAPFRHEYECSDALWYRLFRMHAQAMPAGPGVLILHTLLASAPMAARRPAPEPYRPGLYRRPDGMVLQCAECRRSCRVAPRVWDWVPELVGATDVPLTHGLCPVCLELYGAT